MMTHATRQPVTVQVWDIKEAEKSIRWIVGAVSAIKAVIISATEGQDIDWAAIAYLAEALEDEVSDGDGALQALFAAVANAVKAEHEVGARGGNGNNPAVPHDTGRHPASEEVVISVDVTAAVRQLAGRARWAVQTGFSVDEFEALEQAAAEIGVTLLSGVPEEAEAGVLDQLRAVYAFGIAVGLLLRPGVFEGQGGAS